MPGHGTCAEADSVTRATGAAVSHLGRRVLLGRGNELRHGPRKGANVGVAGFLTPTSTIVDMKFY